MLFHFVFGRYIDQYIDGVVDMYGLEYYWWYWPMLTALAIMSAVLLVKLRRHRRGFYEVLDELFPDPPHRDSWL